jgi:hypothetical protein
MRGLMAHRERASSSSFYPSSTVLKIKLFDYAMIRVNLKKYLSYLKGYPERQIT